MPESEESQHDDRVFKLLDFLMKRLEQTLAHNEASTRHIYLINGAILAAVYFAFGQTWQLWVRFLVAAAFVLLLGIVNWLHANFLHVQHAWYRAIDEEIRMVFLKFKGFEAIWPHHLGEARDRVLKELNRSPRLFRFRQTHAVHVCIHVVLAMFLLLMTVVFIVGAVVYS